MSCITVTAVPEADSRDVHISTSVFSAVTPRRRVISDVLKRVDDPVFTVSRPTKDSEPLRFPGDRHPRIKLRFHM